MCVERIVPRVRKRTNGIGYYMYADEGRHNRPHIHVYYPRFEAAMVLAIDSESVEVLEGRLPPRQTKEARSWTQAHQRELLSMWRRRAEPGGVYPIPD